MPDKEIADNPGQVAPGNPLAFTSHASLAAALANQGGAAGRRCKPN
jgi:hypothetical protein